MGRLAQWWRGLAPTERIMLAVGVPAVAVAALIGGRRGKATAAKDDTAKTAAPAVASYTGPPEFPDTGTQFEIRRQLTEITEYLQDLPGSASASAATGGDPCAPGPGWEPTKCSDTDLINACKLTNGHSTILQEMFRRMVSVNHPGIAGTSCGVQYVRFLLEHGVRPPVP